MSLLSTVVLGFGILFNFNLTHLRLTSGKRLQHGKRIVVFTLFLLSTKFHFELLKPEAFLMYFFQSFCHFSSYAQ